MKTNPSPKGIAMQADLFADTRLVDLDHGHIFTTSVKVAGAFDKNHKDVLRDIRRLLDRLNGRKVAPVESAEIAFNGSKFGPVESVTDVRGRLKIEPSSVISEVTTERKFAPSEAAELAQAASGFEACTYVDEKGETRPMYRMTRNAYSLLANRFTGHKALIWQVRFNNEFDAMEAQLSVMRDRYVGALDILCPPLRPSVERTQAGQDRISIASVIGKSCASVTYYRGKARRLGLLSA